MTLFSKLFLITIPFCAFYKVGLFGNFDANLALAPFLLLLPIILVKTAFVPVLASPRIEAKVMRGFILVMIFASFGTLVNSLILNHTGVSAYGISPLEKASKAFVAPLFLMLLVVSTFIVGSRLSSFQVDKALRIGFYLTCAYTAMQVISVVFTFPPYDYFWPIFEGARPNDTSYIEQSNRVAGTTQEPAEFARLVIIFFLPWIIFPATGERKKHLVFLAMLLVLASLSLTGILLGATAIVYFAMVLRLVSVKQILIILTTVAIIVLALHVSRVFTKITDRVANSGDDQSIAVRYEYNKAALKVIFDHPIFGIGWSNEIFVFPEKITHLGHLWETKRNLEEGSALTARSLALRIGMYVGIPAILVLLYLGHKATNTKYTSRSNPTDNARTRYTFFIFCVSSFIGSGIVTSFYVWAAPALYLGMQFRSQKTASVRSLTTGIPDAIELTDDPDWAKTVITGSSLRGRY